MTASAADNPSMSYRRFTSLALGIAIGVAITMGALIARRAVLTAVRVPNAPPLPLEAEEAFLHRTYGPTKYSQSVEEWVIRDFFGDKREGVFLDVGAADYADGSNTWFLESRLQWSGIAIDAQQQYREQYRKYRPRSRFFALFVSDRSNQTAQLFLSGMSPFVASKDYRFTDQFGKNVGAIDVPTITLDDLLSSLKVSAIDFMSMDIELSEPAALSGFDVEHYRPALACVEAHPQVRQKIIDYFTRRGYAIVGKYLRVDPVNLWFAPIGTEVKPFPLKSVVAH
jgi:FkbM family methyltransferase